MNCITIKKNDDGTVTGLPHDDTQCTELFLDEMMHYEITTEKLNTIKKLYEGYYNTNQYPEEFAVEFFYTIGEILQGKELKDLDLKYLNTEELK